MMIPIEGGEEEEGALARVASGPLSTNSKVLTAGQLELALLARFPRTDACDWDVMGLTVGDPAAQVKGVAVALDPTLEAIDACAAAGCNVLLTHHPVFIEAPARFTPDPDDSSVAAAAVYRAVSKGVALINVHTAFDVSDEARSVLPSMLSLDTCGIVEPLDERKAKGFGALCVPRKSDEPLTLGYLASRCKSVFARDPRVWGSSTAQVRRIACLNGSAGDMLDECLAQDVDAVVCGEVRYHAALDASQRGLGIIEVGHDVSELPYCAALARCAAEAGVPAGAIRIIDQSGNWDTPDAVRL